MEYPDKIIRGDGKKAIEYIREDKVAGYVGLGTWDLREVAERASCHLQIFKSSDVAHILHTYRSFIIEKVRNNKK
jgi:hypothetical protein